MVPNEGGIAVHLNILEVEVVCKVSKFFLEADGMAVSSHIPFGNVPNFKFKGGLISEGIFNFVQFISKEWTKSMSLNLTDRLKSWETVIEPNWKYLLWLTHL